MTLPASSWNELERLSEPASFEVSIYLVSLEQKCLVEDSKLR